VTNLIYESKVLFFFITSEEFENIYILYVYTYTYAQERKREKADRRETEMHAASSRIAHLLGNAGCACRDLVNISRSRTTGKFRDLGSCLVPLYILPGDVYSIETSATSGRLLASRMLRYPVPKRRFPRRTL